MTSIQFFENELIKSNNDKEINIDNKDIEEEEEYVSYDNLKERYEKAIRENFALKLEIGKLKNNILPKNQEAPIIIDNNTSSNFFLLGEIIHIWESVAKEGISECFIDFFSLPEILYGFIQEILSQCKKTILDKIDFLVNTILSICHINKNNNSNVSLITQTVRGFVKEFFCEMFDNDETYENFKSDYFVYVKDKIFPKINIQLQEQFESDFQTPSFRKLYFDILRIIFFIELKDNFVLEQKNGKEGIKPLHLENNECFCVEGLLPSKKNCIILIDTPKTKRGFVAFKELKPIVVSCGKKGTGPNLQVLKLIIENSNLNNNNESEILLSSGTDKSEFNKHLHKRDIDDDTIEEPRETFHEEKNILYNKINVPKFKKNSTPHLNTETLHRKARTNLLTTRYFNTNLSYITELIKKNPRNFNILKKVRNGPSFKSPDIKEINENSGSGYNRLKISSSPGGINKTKNSNNKVINTNNIININNNLNFNTVRTFNTLVNNNIFFPKKKSRAISLRKNNSQNSTTKLGNQTTGVSSKANGHNPGFSLTLNLEDLSPKNEVRTAKSKLGKIFTNKFAKEKEKKKELPQKKKKLLKNKTIFNLLYTNKNDKNQSFEQIFFKLKTKRNFSNSKSKDNK